MVTYRVIFSVWMAHRAESLPRLASPHHKQSYLWPFGQKPSSFLS